MNPLANIGKRLVVFYGVGGLSDVGRHAILAALERPEEVIPKVTVITEYPELLDEKNWECSCPGGHTNPSKDNPERVDVIGISTWNEPQHELLQQHLEGADAVISCLGHRQPGWKHKILKERGLVAHAGNQQIIDVLAKLNPEESSEKAPHVVVMSSVGIKEDDPPMEFHWAGRIMKWLFKGPCKKAFKDLTAMEDAYQKSNVDYVLVRPTGLGEEVVPTGKFYLQQKKHEDAVGMDLAKMDCARFMVEEALNPTKHRVGVVVGSAPPPPKE